jgi:valyl-tRNA synthetase
MSAISAARTIRSEHEVHPAALVPLRLRSNDARSRALLREQSVAISTLVKTDGEPIVEAAGQERPRGSVLSVEGDVEIVVELKGLVEADKERDRIVRLLAKTDKDMTGLQKRLDNPQFVEKAQAEVVAEARVLLERLTQQRRRLVEARTLADEL